MASTTLKSITEESKNIGWFAKLSITFLVLLFLAGIAGYLYYFFKVDKLYARKRKKCSKGIEQKPQSPIDAATAVVTAVFQSPLIIESDKSKESFKDEEMDEISNRPPPIPIKPLPVSLNYEKPLEVDKLPAHLFGKTDERKSNSTFESPKQVRRTGTDEMLNLEKLPSTIPFPEEKK